MRHSFILAILVIPGSLLAAEPANIANWIAELDHDDFARREAATSNLAEAGEAALSALMEATAAEEPEVAWRIREVLTQIADTSEESRTAVGDALRAAGREQLARAVTEKPAMPIEGRSMPVITTVRVELSFDSSDFALPISTETVEEADRTETERLRARIEVFERLREGEPTDE